MENKEKVIKLAHLIVTVVGLALYVISLLQYGSNINRIVFISILVNIVALVLGLIYLAMSYKKNAASFYKAFMWILVISEVIESVSISSTFTPTVADIFRININLVLFTLIAGAKDYGKKNSYLLALCLVVFNVYTVLNVLPTAGNFNIDANLVIFDRIGQLMLAILASLMVCGKYIDKDARGTN